MGESGRALRSIYKMTIGETIYASRRQQWRAWLEKHYNSEEEIWLIFYKKSTGKPNISYNDAVEEALCFGWIDSVRKGLDEISLAHRFTPRKPRSGYSQPNIERLRRMVTENKVIDEVQQHVNELLAVPFDYPEDIMHALKSDEDVWQNFSQFAPAYHRIRIAFVHDGRKREGEFEKRLANLIKKTKANKQYGYGIASYY